MIILPRVVDSPGYSGFFHHPRSQNANIHNFEKTFTVGSSLARVTCETSQVLLAGGQVVFLGVLLFSPHLMIDLAQN